ncbi:hypothetical protein KIPB_012899, partial [Kipferlia bialata]|eukprot:g12899.t1
MEATPRAQAPEEPQSKRSPAVTSEAVEGEEAPVVEAQADVTAEEESSTSEVPPPPPVYEEGVVDIEMESEGDRAVVEIDEVEVVHPTSGNSDDPVEMEVENPNLLEVEEEAAPEAEAGDVAMEEAPAAPAPAAPAAPAPLFPTTVTVTTVADPEPTPAPAKAVSIPKAVVIKK